MNENRNGICWVYGLVASLSLSSFALAQSQEAEKAKQPPGKKNSKDPPGLEKSKLRPREGTLKVGDVVPDLKIGNIDGKNEVALRQLKGKPVVLIFGSCT